MRTEKREEWGKSVRVKGEIEELIDKISEKVGFQCYTVRNTAILFGLIQIAMGYKIPIYDEDFERLLKRVRSMILEWLEGEERAEKG